MFLVIGNPREPCAQKVKAALERRHRPVVVDPDPFGATARLRWRFDTASSSIDYGPCDSTFDQPLEGVFVRQYTGLEDIAGWTVEDASYMRSEGMAALLAWLHALDCPVVGRLSDDGWYRPSRPLPEWVTVLAACGLPTPRLVLSNAAGVERLAHEWAGRATYQPLTSPRSYAIGGGGWQELAKVMQHIPVCLTEPIDAPLEAVTLACGRFFWSQPVGRDRSRFEDGVQRVAQRLESNCIQILYTNGAGGAKFTKVEVAPALQRHRVDDQTAIAEQIAAHLTSDHALDEPFPRVSPPASGEVPS